LVAAGRPGRHLDFEGETCDHVSVPARWLVSCIAAAVVAVPWAFAVQKLVSPRPVVWGESPTSLVWGDRVFSSPRSFAGWLWARGRPYKDWVPLHPQGVAILTHQPYLPPPPRVSAARAASSSATTAITNPAITGGARPRSGLKLAVQIFLLVLASVLLVTALTPSFLLSRGPTGLRYLVQANRAYVAVVAIAILLGYVVQGLG
jgi:hypothetical protein